MTEVGQKVYYQKDLILDQKGLATRGWYHTYI